ncbi:Dak1 domain-containing protein [Myxozyma melibiosi]|uniref:Dak1 domain-containing protein n=1 Tax=Myxozyma melibiosi TaxID=54550 RepID=A0ABR1F560_9ASCO
MSTKHFFADAPSLVIQHLTALVEANPALRLIADDRVVYDPAHDPSTLSIVSGGGSGHEPAWSGLVGKGLLAAAVNGPIFGSPSAKQVVTGIESVPSDKGSIIVITNYTGDRLHFGLALEKVRAKYPGKQFAILAATDDVALGRKRTGAVGRRGLAGNILVLKVLGGAAAAGVSFDKAVAVGTAINANTVTIGSSLDHCHVPGRQNHETLPDDVLILGMGIHNEPGLRKLSPLPTIQELLSEMVRYLVDPNDEERAYVKFDKGDDVVLLINNFGGLSALETGAITYQTLDVLKKEWDIAPIRVFSDSFESSLNGPGFSATLLNLTKAAAELGVPTAEVIAYLDAPTTAPSFPKPYRASSAASVNGTSNGVAKETTSAAEVDRPDFTADSKLIESMLRKACTRAIDSEPSLTKWDMIMGDGDCGDGVKAVSTAILKLLDAKPVSNSILGALELVGEAVDDMGGTLGAIFGILVAALATAVTRRATAGKLEMTPAIWGECAHEALASLMTHTAAREGDRTVMDVLIPFCNSLYKSKDLATAVQAAKNAAEGTWDMKPKFGRATYVTGGDDDGRIPPDPGAWAVYEMVEGLLEGSA